MTIGTVWTAIFKDGCWLKFEHGDDAVAALAYAEIEFGDVARVERENGAAQSACDNKSNPLNRETMKCSDVIRVMQQFIERHGDRPVEFSDGFFRYGVTMFAEGAAIYDSPRAMLVKAFSLTTGMDGPRAPIALEHP